MKRQATDPPEAEGGLFIRFPVATLLQVSPNFNAPKQLSGNISSFISLWEERSDFDITIQEFLRFYKIKRELNAVDLNHKPGIRVQKFFKGKALMINEFVLDCRKPVFIKQLEVNKIKHLGKYFVEEIYQGWIFSLVNKKNELEIQFMTDNIIESDMEAYVEINVAKILTNEILYKGGSPCFLRIIDWCKTTKWDDTLHQFSPLTPSVFNPILETSVWQYAGLQLMRYLGTIIKREVDMVEYVQYLKHVLYIVWVIIHGLWVAFDKLLFIHGDFHLGNILMETIVDGCLGTPAVKVEPKDKLWGFKLPMEGSPLIIFNRGIHRNIIPKIMDFERSSCVMKHEYSTKEGVAVSYLKYLSDSIQFSYARQALREESEKRGTDYLKKRTCIKVLQKTYGTQILQLLQQVKITVENYTSQLNIYTHSDTSAYYEVFKGKLNSVENQIKASLKDKLLINHEVLLAGLMNHFNTNTAALNNMVDDPLVFGRKYTSESPTIPDYVALGLPKNDTKMWDDAKGKVFLGKTQFEVLPNKSWIFLPPKCENEEEGGGSRCTLLGRYNGVSSKFDNKKERTHPCQSCYYHTDKKEPISGRHFCSVICQSHYYQSNK